jgi:hypothetical protein
MSPGKWGRLHQYRISKNRADIGVVDIHEHFDSIMEAQEAAELGTLLTETGADSDSTDRADGCAAGGEEKGRSQMANPLS